MEVEIVFHLEVFVVLALPYDVGIEQCLEQMGMDQLIPCVVMVRPDLLVSV